eukprot:5379795-Pleurochrysis_carterae.AAC.2
MPAQACVVQLSRSKRPTRTARDLERLFGKVSVYHLVELPDLGRSGGRSVRKLGRHWLSHWTRQWRSTSRLRLPAVRDEQCKHRLVVDWVLVGDRAIARGGGCAGMEDTFK